MPSPDRRRPQITLGTVMATFTWKTAGFSGNFETAANWTPAGPPERRTTPC
jgi:hypothetical protein